MTMHKQNGNWFEDRGDETVALDWPIGPEALVWEIGGFAGRWAKQMVDKFDCRMEIFEPQDWAVERLSALFLGIKPKVHIYPYGLWVTNATLPMYNWETDGCTLIEKAGEKVGHGNFVDVYHFSGDPDVDVCLMNIEGAEFALLPYMLGIGMMKKFKFFWCQFHPGLAANGDERANRIFKGILNTHHKLWDYYPTAVAWERKT
jgi:hypothetical protein